MSRLPKAPLVEVIFELRWNLAGQDLMDAQYLHGDLYPLLKDTFPWREIVQLLPIEISTQNISHRFRPGANEYPLIQVGPGIITVNTTDSKYHWAEYQQLVRSVLQNLSKVNSFKAGQNRTAVLQYIDFIAFDFQTGDAMKFLHDNFNVEVSQSFFRPVEATKNIALIFNFNTQIGNLTVNIGSGKNSHGADGFVIQTNITGQTDPAFDSIHGWLNEAHAICSKLFKDLIKGDLYNTFS